MTETTVAPTAPATRYLCKLDGMTLNPSLTLDAIAAAVERGYPVTILSVWVERAN